MNTLKSFASRMWFIAILLQAMAYADNRDEDPHVLSHLYGVLACIAAGDYTAFCEHGDQLAGNVPEDAFRQLVKDWASAIKRGYSVTYIGTFYRNTQRTDTREKPPQETFWTLKLGPRVLLVRLSMTGPGGQVQALQIEE